MSLLGWRQWAVDRDGLLRPAWTPWTPFPAGLLLWRPDGLTRAHCLRDTHAVAGPPPALPVMNQPAADSRPGRREPALRPMTPRPMTAKSRPAGRMTPRQP